MSEINDAMQLIIVTGKGAYLISNMTVKSAVLVLKVLNTIYLAKWHGRVSLNRLRRICGGDFVFVNVNTEDSKIFKSIEKEMKAHGILYARLPDLCGGDRRTQYVIPPADMIKLKAFLLDHREGKHKDVKVGPISPEDYAKTGITAAGRPTPELAELTQSALNALPDKTAVHTSDDLLPIEEVLQVPEVWDTVKKDPNISFGRHVSWIKGKPVKEHSNWGMFNLPDGVHAVLIPQEDIVKERRKFMTRQLTPAEYAIFDAKNYTMINLKNGEKHLETGRNVIRAMHHRENSTAIKDNRVFQVNQKIENTRKGR